MMRRSILALCLALIAAHARAQTIDGRTQFPLAAGRDFADADREGTQLVAIVGEGSARQFWPGKPLPEAVGNFLVLPTLDSRGKVDTTQTLLVVGVVRDVKASSLVDGLSRSLVYV